LQFGDMFDVFGVLACVGPTLEDDKQVRGICFLF